MLNILYVDENEAYRKSFTKELEKAGYSVDSVVGPIEGLELLSINTYQIVMSELEFESFPGLRFLESVFNIVPEAKRVILTKNKDIEFEIEALKARIDLYLLKDRGVELALESLAVLKKDIKVQASDEKYLIGKGCDLKMDLVSHVVTVKDEVVHLTPKEFEILKLLLENKGQYVSRYYIIKKIWDSKEDKEIRIVDTHIKKSVKKQTVLKYKRFVVMDICGVNKL